MKKIFTLIALATITLTASADQYNTRMYMLGDATATGWSIDDMNLMATDEVGRYHWVGHLKEGWFRFKVNNTSGDWKNCYGPAVNGAPFETGTLTFHSNDNPDEAPSYHLTVEGDYRIDIDLLGDTPTVTVTPAGDQQPTAITAQHPHYLYPIGDALTYGWDLDQGRYQPLRETAYDNGVYEGIVHLDGDGGELKFLCKADWGSHYGPAEGGAPLATDGTTAIALHTDGDYKYAVSGITGDLKATINLDDLTLTLTDPATGIVALHTTMGATTVKKVEQGEITIHKDGKRYTAAGIRK